MIANYHGHTMHCKHGVGTTREHIEAAIKFGLKEVAITEHVPIKGTNLSRIDYQDFDAFITELNQLKIEFADRIKILTGLECEYIPELMQYHLELKTKYDIDFLVLGHHFSNLNQVGHYFFETKTTEMIDEYFEYVTAAVKSGLFAIFAHPDVFLNRIPLTDYTATKSRELLELCVEYNLPVEINGNGFRNNKGYPNRDFWTIASEYDLQVVINADSHAPHEVYDDGVKAAYQFAEELGIKVTERLEF